MARVISRAEAWERAHEVFTQVNFNAFDYTSIKESLLDYVKLYFPEDFNDYIESSEFVAILELFAYVGELLAYRIDLNAHENFITTAQRKESILRLAKLISYKVSRNIPARGLVKLTSVQTTETVIDSAGRNLAGRRIYWNDGNNPDWKEQFLLVLNRVFEQEFGTVSQNERVQVNDILFELYTLNNNPFGTGTSATIQFSADAGGVTAPMEAVPIQLTANGPEERRPVQNAKFSLVYANDGLGDGSDTTGFLMFVKQGQLAQRTITFDGVTPNQTYDLPVNNINETDLWLNNIDSETGAVLTTNPYEDLLPHLVSDDLLFGEWEEVDLSNAQNILFNTNRNRHKYEVETLDNDQVRLIFGDGEFSDIPSGTFQLWFRTSLNEDILIEKTSIVDQTATLSYTDLVGSVQTLSITFSLVSSLQNASASEDIEHIRRVAPSVYYTQDRMVNGRDYNSFMLQDPSILKLRAINRTFAGDSKYIAWHDPRENYEDVKIFGDDLALYWVENPPEQGLSVDIPATTDIDTVITNYLEPLLSGTDFMLFAVPLRESLGLVGGQYRTYFTPSELVAISGALLNATTPVELFYTALTDAWTVGSGGVDSVKYFVVEQLGGNEWNIRSLTRRLVVHSQTTRFWNSNTSTRVINFDTLNSRGDRIVVLKANTNAGNTSLLSSNKNYVVLAQELVDDNSSNLPDIHRLSVATEDVNGDGIPDDLVQEELIDLEFEGDWQSIVDLQGGEYIIDIFTMFGKKINNSETKGLDYDVIVYAVDGSNTTRLTFAGFDLLIPSALSTNLVVDKIKVNSSVVSSLFTPSTRIRIIIRSFVYFERTLTNDGWIPIDDTDANRVRYLSDTDSESFIRVVGRYPLNFAWFHYTPRLNLVDPAASNIIDMYIITKGYYTAITQWLAGVVSIQPKEPTPFELRSAYSNMVENKMISDTVILHSGSFKILFGSKAIPQLQAQIKIIRPDRATMTDNQVKTEVVNVVRAFFTIDHWEFGETFFFSELSASIHAALGPEVDSVVLVPTHAQNQFGDLMQIYTRENEMFIPDISTEDIDIIQSITPESIRQKQ
jgi:hypothetical protein